MKRIILSLLLTFLMAPSCFAFYEVKENLNIHSTPTFGNNRIDYYQKGTVVNVIEKKGDWCKVDHYKYPQAYVYCSYLQVTDKDYINPIKKTPTEIKKLLSQMQPPVPYEIIRDLFKGTKIALTDINVRSTPGLGNNRMGYIKKGTQVEITDLKGDWCKLNYKNFAKAYVYCTLLGIEDSLLSQNTISKSEKPKPQYSIAIQKLNELYHWTMDNNEAGRFYINNSGRIGLEKAKKWQTDAERAGFRFDFPRKFEGYCIHYFVSPSDPDNIFEYHCAEPGNEGSSKIIPRKETPYIGEATPADFKVPFAVVVQLMIDGNGEVWPKLQNYFRDSKKVQMEFTLSTKDKDTSWVVRVYNEHGSMIKLKLNATDSHPSFLIFSGNIKNEKKT